MTRPTGKADLPLHGGRVPAWLADRMAALARLDQQSRKLEGMVTGPSFDAFIAAEREQSSRFGGRSVLLPPPPSN